MTFTLLATLIVALPLWASLLRYGGSRSGDPVGARSRFQKTLRSQEEVMAVEARFYVSHVGKRPQGGAPDGAIGEVELQASTKGPNNWSQWTPAASIKLATLNPEAMAWFDAHLGKDVRVVIDDVPTEGAD